MNQQLRNILRLGQFWLVLTSVCLAAQPALVYPPAARGPTIDDYFGVAVADPYRWLEDLDSPETRTWVAEQKRLTDSYLHSISSRSRIRTGLVRLSDFEKFGVPFEEGGRYFYNYNSGRQDQSVLYTLTDWKAKPVIAVDPNALSSDGSLAAVGYVASRDGKLLAYGVSVGGSDWTDWHIRDLAAGKDLPDELRFTKYYPPVFSRDGRGLYYSAFPAPPAGQELSATDRGNALYYHVLGTAVADDRVVLANASHPDWQFEPHLSSDGRWLVVAVGEGEVGDTGLENIYLFDLHASTLAPIPVVEGFDASYIFIDGDRGLLYFLTTLDAPRGRVIAVDPMAPARDHWKNAIAEAEDAITLTEPSVNLIDHQLIVRRLHDAHSRVTAYGLDGTARHEIELPGPGWASGFIGRPEQGETFYTYTDLITPPTLYRYDVESGQSTRFRSPRAAFDRAQFEQRQVFYPSKDGTRIPMLLAYRKGLRVDGRNPTLLYGYGGFGIPVWPEFTPARMEWLELGGIYAIANIRGGGEYGEAWHRQAIRTHKQVVFDDFIAAAEWLVGQHYTERDRLAITGESNGGLLIGACLTRRPDLFGAAIAKVGVMDMLRFDRFGQGSGWVGDYGSPHDRDEFMALRAYSPVHNVHAGTRYPATLVITGDHDTRVMPMHSFKFAAAIQAAQAGPAPILLELEPQSGHGGGTTQTAVINQSADIYAFLLRNLKMHAPP